MRLRYSAIRSTLQPYDYRKDRWASHSATSKSSRLFLLHRAGVLHGSGRCIGSERVPDKLVDVGGAMDRPEEQRLEHAAVDAKQCVKGQKKCRVAEFLRRVRSLHHFLQSLTRFRVDGVGNVTTLQCSRTLTYDKHRPRHHMEETEAGLQRPLYRRNTSIIRHNRCRNHWRKNKTKCLKHG